MLLTEHYISDRFASLEELQAKHPHVWDATSAGIIGECARRGQHALQQGLISKEESPAMRAGKAIHGALAVLYTTGDRDAALLELRLLWGTDGDMLVHGNEKYKHLSLGHLEVVMKNYFDWAAKSDTFTPIVKHRDELDLTNVLYAEWRLDQQERVILGESKFMMVFPKGEWGLPEDFVYAGRPDLPVSMGNRSFVFDHKSTNAYLSDYWFDQHRFSNQLRGYGAMLNMVLGEKIAGALINGIYIGKSAVSSEFKGSRFARFGPLLFQFSHLVEAVKNQYGWAQAYQYYEQSGYFPQHTGRCCNGCAFAPLCNTSVVLRDAAIKTDYIKGQKSFYDL